MSVKFVCSVFFNGNIKSSTQKLEKLDKPFSFVSFSNNGYSHYILYYKLLNEHFLFWYEIYNFETFKLI